MRRDDRVCACGPRSDGGRNVLWCEWGEGWWWWLVRSDGRENVRRNVDSPKTVPSARTPGAVAEIVISVRYDVFAAREATRLLDGAGRNGFRAKHIVPSTTRPIEFDSAVATVIRPYRVHETGRRVVRGGGEVDPFRRFTGNCGSTLILRRDRFGRTPASHGISKRFSNYNNIRLLGQTISPASPTAKLNQTL